jgi:hypothetical protein
MLIGIGLGVGACAFHCRKLRQKLTELEEKEVEAV